MSKPSILIVEDENIVALDIESRLAQWGYSIAGQADRGEDAVQKASTLAPDLILMDIGLRGDMDGIEAAIQIRAQFDLPVIFLTAYATPSVLERAREAEPFGFVVKPFDERELVGNIEMAVYKHSREKNLRTREARLTGVIENCTDAIALADGYGNLIEWNPAAERITGLARADVLGTEQWRVMFRLLPKERQTDDMAQALQLQWNEQVDSGYTVGLDRTMDIEIETPGGVRRTLQASAFPIPTPQGRLAGAIIRDITDNQKMQEDLRDLLAREQLMGDIIRQASTMIGAFGLDDRRILVNDSVLRKTGYSADELLSATVDSDLTPPDWRSLEADKQAELRALLGPVQYQSEVQRKDGSRFPVEVIMHPHFDELGGMDSYFIFANDITERKLVEQKLEELITELQRKNAELEQFTYTVSHDLRAPLVTILGFLGFLEKDIFSGHTDRMQRDIVQIVDAANRMQRLLVELLELSRVGKSKSTSRWVPFEKIARSAAANLAGRISQSGVRLSIAPDLPRIFCDETRMTQVLQNLIENAVKFMGDQTEPHIEVGQRTDADGETVFFVRDNGAGIEPQFHEHIFGLFDKLDNHVDGTGIGLALVKRIVEIHGGRIWVESQGRGTGATFCFTVPAPETPDE